MTYCLLLIVIVVCCISTADAQEQQNPLTANGGSVLAMAGDGCVALAVDKRFASGNQVRNTNRALSQG